MIINYFKIALRNLLKYKSTSFINLFGLTIGICCCLMILTYIIHELSYDKYNNNADRIYRVTRSFRNAESGAVSLNLGCVAPPFAPLLENDFKEIEKTTRLLPVGTTVLRYKEKIFNEQDVFFADEKFFDFFKVHVTKGSPHTALNDPYSIMLTQEMATKYFGNEDPMNKMVSLGNTLNLKVTGLYEPLPANSHIHPTIMISFNTLKDSSVYGEKNLRTNWGNNSFFTYLLLPQRYDIKKMEAQFPAFLDRHMGQGEGTKPSKWTALALQKLTDIHLYSHFDSEIEESGDIKRVYIFSAVALFILLIACINYMNLSTARSTIRAKEIGIRKVVGASRKEIIAQFLSESVLITFVAFLIAFLLTSLLLPWLNNLSGLNLGITMLYKWQIILPMVFAPFLIGTISSIYPSMYMSSFRPVLVLKGLFKAGGGNIFFRRLLVTVQFAISIILIISTAIIFRQMQYIHEKALGFDKEQIVTLPYPAALSDKFEAFRNSLLNNPGIKNAGRSSRIPTGRLLDAMGAKIRKNDTLAPAGADIKFVTADKDFLNTYGVNILAGRGFSRDFATDTSSFLINEAAARALGFTNNDDALGKDFAYGSRKGKLVGVFNDFNFESMHQKITPLVLLMPQKETNYGNISVKMYGANIPSTLNFIEKTWRKFLPEVPYQFVFLDEKFEKLYQSEQRQQMIFTVFAGIAIFIACLGLFGLSAFAIGQRIKEIGIRKVLGAGIGTIVTLLSKDFLKLVIVAALIAFPIAGWAMNQWLQDFAYRIAIPYWVFILAGLSVMIIALATVSFITIKAALANPVKSLRSE